MGSTVDVKKRHKEQHFESKLEQLSSPSEERVKTQTLGMRRQRDRCECEEEEDATGRESVLCFCCFYLATSRALMGLRTERPRHASTTLQ